MDATNILREILGRNATNSGRIRDMQRGGNGGGGLGDALEDLLGVHEDGDESPRQRVPERRVEVQPAPRSRQIEPPVSAPQPKRKSGGLLDDLLGGILGGRASTPAQEAPPERPAPDLRPRQRPSAQQDQAVFLIRAMCHAAKVDGAVDRQEQEAILGRLGNVTEEELDFVRSELASPLDVTSFCRSVPDELAEQVYGFSVMAIQVDTLREAAYLGRLAQGLGLDERVCDRLHEKMGAPVLFT